MPVYELQPQKNIGDVLGGSIGGFLANYIASKRAREEDERRNRQLSLEEQLGQSQIGYNEARAQNPYGGASRFKPLIRNIDGKWHTVITDVVTGEIVKDLGIAPAKQTWEFGEPAGGPLAPPTSPGGAIDAQNIETGQTVPKMPARPQAAPPVIPRGLEGVPQSHMALPQFEGPPSPWTPIGTPRFPQQGVPKLPPVGRLIKKGPAAEEERVEVEDKDGKRYTVPMSQLQQALDLGYKKVK